MKKGKKGLALAMTLAVTMTSVPTAFALDGNAQPTKQPDNQLDQRDTKAISYKYTKLDQTPMKESVKASSENTPMQWSEGPANLAFDGDVNTGWHTDYNTHQGPYTIEWNLGGTYKIGKVEYTRKKTGAAGIWKEIKIEVKNGETGSWQTAYNGTIAETADGASTDITFEPVDASDVKVTVVKSYDNPEGKYASAGEINVYSATKEVTLVNPIKILPEEGKTNTMKEGETQQFRYELTQEAEEAGGTVEWRVQDSSILKVDENGFVTAVSAGKGKVSANYKLGNTTYNTYIDVTVEKVETECTISLNGTQYKGMSLQEVVEQSKLTELTSVKFESGVIRDTDFDYLKKFNRLQWTLKEFSIGDDVKLRGLSGDAIPLNAFYASYPGYNIEKVYLGKNVKGMGMNAFGMCRSLISFEAPGLEEMHTTALNRVNGLAELNLPSLKVVNDPLFGNMSNSATETVKLPAVTELDDDAFKYLGALKTLELGATPPSLSISAGELKFAKGVVDNLKLVIPEGALDAYKASPGYNAEQNTWYGIKLSEHQEEVHINATINGTAVDGASLEKAVEKSGVAVDAVTSLTINSGKVTQEDLAYLKSISRLETFEMNVGDNLQLIGMDGHPTTVLSKDTAVIEFAPKRAGSSRADMTTLTLGGITEIYNGGLKAYDSIETIHMPDVVTVGASAFGLGAWLETLDLSSAKTIGANAFNGCKRLESLTMNAVETLGEGSFKYTDALDSLTLPATIKNIEDIRFGICKNGNKSGAKITILATTPPTVDSAAFTGVSSVTRPATVTVPQGALAAYVAQVNPKADVAKVLKRQDINWNSLYLREEGSSLVEYKAKCGTWADQYAYVATGQTITADKLAALHKDDQKNLKENEELKGWNTKKDGSGDMVTAETVVSEEMTVYPVIGEKADLDVAVSYSNVDEAGETIWTNQDVTVTLTANEPVQDIEGWTRVSDTVLTKAYSQNGTYSVTVVSNDNQQKEVTYTVAGIDKQAPNVSVKGEGNGDRFRKITGIAVHDTEGVKELKVNDTVTEINSKYKYLTDIEKIGVKEGENTAVVVDQAGNEKTVTFHYDTVAPTFQWIVDNSKLEQSKEVRLETSEEIQLPGEGWSLKGQENGTYVYVKTFTANWKDKAFTVTDLAGNVSEPQFVEVKRIDNTKPAVVELTQDITDWTKKDVTVTIKTSVDCATPEGWKKVNKRTFTKVFTASGEYSVTLTSATGVTGDAYVFSITNIDKEAPVIDYAAIEAAKGYKREIPLNEGEEYTEEQLTEMFTKPEWVKDNSGTAAFKVDKWGLEHGLDGYQPFTSKIPGEYKVRFYAYDAAGNSSSFDVYVKVLEPEVPEVEERTTTVNYTVFVDHRVRTGQWTHTGTETGDFTFDLSMVKYLPSNYKLAEGETGYRVLQYGDTTAVTFYLTTK